MGDEIEISGHKVSMTAALHAIAKAMLARSSSNYSVEHGGFRVEVSILPNAKSGGGHEPDHECG